MGAGPSRSGYPARANPKNIQPALFSSLEDLMRWEEKLPGIRQLLTAQALTTQLSSTLKPSRDEDPMSIRRALQAPNAKSTTALVHTATETADAEQQTQEQSSWIPGPVIPSSSLFAEVAIAEVKRSAELLKPIPPIEEVRQQPLLLQSMTHQIQEKQPETSGKFTSLVAPAMPVEQAARVLGLTRRDLEIRREIEKEMSELADTPEMKERTALICKYFYIHCLMQKMVKSSEHCYKIQQKLNFTSSRLRDPRLRPMERVNTEKRLHTAQTLLQDALGNHDNASWALSWLRRDFELCSALYDVNTDIAAARLEHRDVTMLMERRQRILVDLNMNERDSLNIGMLYLDKNFDGVLDAEEVPMLSARLFALLDRDRHHAITRENLQRAAMEANDHLVELETRLSQLQRDAEMLESRATTNEEAAATLQRIKDEQQQLEDKHTTLLATVRAIYRYFHRAFTLHLFSTLDDQHVQPGSIGASQLFRVMDDVMLSSYYDHVKPAASYYSKEEEQNLLYDTLGPMRKGLVPSHLPAIAGASRLEGATIEYQVSPRTRDRAKEMSRVYPTSETTREYMPPQETEQERRIREDRDRQRMMQEVEEKETQRQQEERMRRQRMEEQERQHQQQIMMERQRERERQETETMIRRQQQQQHEEEMRTRARIRAQQEQEQKQREMEMEKRAREEQETMRSREMERQQQRREQEERQREMDRQQQERQQQERQREMERQQERERERERERRRAEEQRQYEMKIQQQQQQQQQQQERERERERERQQERRRAEEQRRQQEERERERKQQERRRVEEQRQYEIRIQQQQQQQQEEEQERLRRATEVEQARQQEMQRQYEMKVQQRQQEERERQQERERERELQQQQQRAEEQRQYEMKIQQQQQQEEQERRRAAEAEQARQQEMERQREREEQEYRTYQQQQQQRLRMEKEQEEKRQKQEMEETKRVQPQIQAMKQVPEMESKYQRGYGMEEEEQPQPAQAYPTSRDKSWLAEERDAIQQRRPSEATTTAPSVQPQVQQQRGVGMLTETEEDQDIQKRYIPRDVLAPMREETSLKTPELKEREPESTSGHDIIRPREESDATIRVRAAAY